VLVQAFVENFEILWHRGVGVDKRSLQPVEKSRHQEEWEGTLMAALKSEVRTIL
jgi:hypothetical protein